MREEQKNSYRMVLLIDDNEIDNIITKKYLQHISFADHVVTKHSAVMALEYLKTIDDESVPDIIFLDIRMPEMDGFEFLAEYARLENKIKDKSRIVMLSSSLDFEDISRATSNQYVYKFLNKPLQKDELKRISSEGLVS